MDITVTEQALTKIKPTLLPLVAGLEQLDTEDIHDAYFSETTGNGFYSTNDAGNLVSLIIKSNIPELSLLSQCTSLERLLFNDIELNEIPKEIFQLKSLNELRIRFSNIKEIPAQIANLSNLETLDLEYNSITKIPESISKLNNLSTLDLSSNSIVEIPISLFSCKSLDALYITHNNIKHIPEEIKNLKNLHFLMLNNNKITTLPSSIGLLQNLQFLMLSDNQITEIGDLLKPFKNLFHLSLLNNNIKDLKNKLPSVAIRLDLEGNDLTIPDPSFHELMPNEKIEVLNNFDEATLKPLKQAKILVVGDERVGKTSIINRLLGHSHNENQTSTQGIDISELTFNDYTANMWDFAGQELTHQTHQFFLTERSLYIYVLDAQKEDNQARDLHWLNTIKSYSADSPIIVVANHSDQNLNYQFDLQRYQDDFNIIQVIDTSACNLNTLSKEVKNKIGDSIERLISEISNQLPKLNGINRLLPESWHKVKESIESYKKTENIIAKDIYDDECQKQGIEVKPLQTALLKILNSIGTVVAYPNDFRLKLTQILKPEWVTNAVYKIVRSPQFYF